MGKKYSRWIHCRRQNVYRRVKQNIGEGMREKLGTWSSEENNNNKGKYAIY